MAINIGIFDQKDWRFWLSGQKYKTTTAKFVDEWGAQEDADLCFNLGIFKMIWGVNLKTGRKEVVAGEGCCYVHTPTGDLGYGGASDVLEFGAYACQGYSNGIKNGIVGINHQFGGSSLRNGIGITTRDQIIVAQSTSAMTEKAFCQAVNNEVKKRGQTVALFVLEDGGGSTSEFSGRSKLTYYPGGSRRVTTVICAKLLKVPAYTRVLRFGCRGEDVRLLQMVLGGIQCDGIFGLGTRARVKMAQKALNIAVDGSVGPITWNCLFRGNGC